MTKESNWKSQIEKSFKRDELFSESHIGTDTQRILDLHDEFIDIALMLSMQEVLSQFLWCMEGVLKKIESPIEKALFVSIVTMARLHVQQQHYIVNFGEGKVLHYGDWTESYDRLTIETQKPIGKYKVDFLIRYSCHIPDEENISGNTLEIRELIVECDGHDFHEKTKEQASRDKKRDIYLQELGYRVYRFTGSDIWKDPAGCAATIINSLTDFEKNKIFIPKIVKMSKVT